MIWYDLFIKKCELFEGNKTRMMRLYSLYLACILYLCIFNDTKRHIKPIEGLSL